MGSDAADSHLPMPTGRGGGCSPSRQRSGCIRTSGRAHLQHTTDGDCCCVVNLDIYSTECNNSPRCWGRWVDGGFFGVLCSFRLSVSSPEVKFMNVQFREVSGHNLESSQTWGFCMDFLNHREEGMVFYQVFLLSPLQCKVTELSG